MASALDVTDGVKGVLVKEADGKGYGVFAAKLFKEENWEEYQSPKVLFWQHCVFPLGYRNYKNLNESEYVNDLKKKIITSGDIIFEETPIVSCQFAWNTQYGYTACHHCMRSMETAQNMARRLTTNYELELPNHEKCCENVKNRKFYTECPKCKVPFCCEECLYAANESYHELLCIGEHRKDREHPINVVEEEWKRLHYPPETATIMLILRMIAMVIQCSNPDLLLNKFNQFYQNIKNEEQRFAHKLLGEQFQERIVFLHKLLMDVIPEDKAALISSIEKLQALLGLIGMNGQGIGTSSLSQYVHKMEVDGLSESDDRFIDKLYDDIDKVSGRFLNCEGSGLYALQSRCNHSCIPNAEVTFPYNNHRLVCVAMTEIQQHEEICLCYLDECERMRSRHSRRKKLRENYMFNCKCARCEEECDQPSATSSEEDSDSEMST